MLAKWWKKIGLFILIVACLWNITSKLVKKMSFNDNLKSTIKTKSEEIFNEDNEENVDNSDNNSQNSNERNNYSENNQNYQENQ